MRLVIFKWHRQLNQKWNDDEVDEDDDQTFKEVEKLNVPAVVFEPFERWLDNIKNKSWRQNE